MMMLKYFTTPIGRYRLLTFLEGVSLLVLMFIAVPLKYYFEQPFLVKLVGNIHGILFILFVYETYRVAIKHKWKFTQTTWKVLISSFIPLGTFYIDHKILQFLEDKPIK